MKSGHSDSFILSMNPEETIDPFKQIKAALNCLDKSTQCHILWLLLENNLSGDAEAVGWLLERLNRFLDDEGKKLLSPYQ
jgi:hypothetical protein